MVDSRLHQLFEDGSGSAALVGDGRFYIPAPGFAIHDRLFVLRELCRWSMTGRTGGRAAAAIESALDQLVAESRPDDVVDLLIAAGILSEDLPAILELLPASTVDRLADAERLYLAAGELDARRSKALDVCRSTVVRRMLPNSEVPPDAQR